MAGDRRRADHLAPLVDDEAAVGVAVEDQRQVGAVLDAPRAGRRPGSPAPAGSAGGSGRCRRGRCRARSAPGRPSRAPPAGCARPSRCRRRRPPSAGGCRSGRRGSAGGPRTRGAGRSPTARPGPAPGTGGDPIARSAISRSCAGAIGRAAGQAELDPVVLPRVVAGGEHRARAGPSRPEANHSWSVLASPMSTTSAPRLSTPSTKAADIAGLLSRMSRPTTRAPSAAFRSRVSTSAAPIAYAPAASHSGLRPVGDAADVVGLEDSWRDHRGERS